MKNSLALFILTFIFSLIKNVLCFSENVDDIVITELARYIDLTKRYIETNI